MTSNAVSVFSLSMLNIILSVWQMYVYYKSILQQSSQIRLEKNENVGIQVLFHCIFFRITFIIHIVFTLVYKDTSCSVKDCTFLYSDFLNFRKCVGLAFNLGGVKFNSNIHHNIFADSLDIVLIYLFLNFRNAFKNCWKCQNWSCFKTNDSSIKTSPFRFNLTMYKNP